jgi:hypothetical protein
MLSTEQLFHKLGGRQNKVNELKLKLDEAELRE